MADSLERLGPGPRRAHPSARTPDHAGFSAIIDRRKPIGRRGVLPHSLRPGAKREGESGNPCCCSPEQPKAARQWPMHRHPAVQYLLRTFPPSSYPPTLVWQIRGMDSEPGTQGCCETARTLEGASLRLQALLRSRHDRRACFGRDPADLAFNCGFACDENRSSPKKCTPHRRLMSLHQRRPPLPGLSGRAGGGC
ncbi:hypothetical protein GQ53DRAFT_261842 [Thozetella sp. PMI_491]|nr:hypothetical protein GQ53DRAFT_261842 [Thozetella sp. PMI_491]